MSLPPRLILLLLEVWVSVRVPLEPQTPRLSFNDKAVHAAVAVQQVCVQLLGTIMIGFHVHVHMCCLVSRP